MGKTIRIGGASGYWGESAIATPQLLKTGKLDYIVYDYLAEITMSIMARAKAKNPEAGYATDFITAVLKPHLKEIAKQGVKILSNAGGVNPEACGAAARALIKEQGLDLKVAVIKGDNLLDQKEAIADANYDEMFSGGDFPALDKIQSINAYLGGFPVAEALAGGADIVITGRSVDSAVTLGACIHEFGWGADDLDKLAQGSLCGHILECGPQATGGNFTDWHLTKTRIHDIGYPIAEISEDGSFLTTKGEGTGGIVNVGTVSEQMLYEIGDPKAYYLPDVVCDFTEVTVTQKGDNLVEVKGAKGAGVPDTYKVSLTYQDGFRTGTLMTFYGLDAEEKARTHADNLLTRVRNIFRAHNFGDFSEVSIEVLGSDSQFGVARQIEKPLEVVMKLAVKHEEQLPLGILLKEAAGIGLATPPGLSGFAGGRAKPSPVVRLFSFLIPKDKIDIVIDMDAEDTTYSLSSLGGDVAVADEPAAPEIVTSKSDWVDVPLIHLAWGRSGDKGNKANVGIIAREADYLPYIWNALSEEEVARRFAHFLDDPEATSVDRFHMPGSNAINFLMDNVLGGGGVASIRNDPQGKGYAQILLTTPIPVPADIAAKATAAYTASRDAA